MTMITPSAQLTLTKGNKSWVPHIRRVQPAVVSIRTISSGIFRSEALDDPNVRRVLGLPDDVVILQTGVTATRSEL